LTAPRNLGHRQIDAVADSPRPTRSSPVCRQQTLLAGTTIPTTPLPLLYPLVSRRPRTCCVSSTPLIPLSLQQLVSKLATTTANPTTPPTPQTQPCRLSRRPSRSSSPATTVALAHKTAAPAPSRAMPRAPAASARPLLVSHPSHSTATAPANNLPEPHPVVQLTGFVGLSTTQEAPFNRTPPVDLAARSTAGTHTVHPPTATVLVPLTAHWVF
jgi:hypothetical protein